MTSIDDLKHDLKGVSDGVLGDLDTEERLRVFIKEAAEDREERIEWLRDTAPRYEYTATDLEYTNGTLKVSMMSLMARNQLYQNYQAIEHHEATRDKYMALMMLNETLARLSRRGFDVDEYGNVDVPEGADAEYNAYGDKQAPEISYLATRYRELWDELPLELLVDEDERAVKQFPGLAASGLLAYPSDLSGEMFDDLDDDRIDSEVYLTELRLLKALVDFHINFHGWRLFAEEHLEVSFDEFLNAPVPGDSGASAPSGVVDLDEDLCRSVLSLNRDYLEAYPALLKEWADADGLEECDEEVTADLDARAREFADGLAEDTDLPGVTPDA